VKSSNTVMLSALVQTPTLPASEKLSSVASMTFLPSKMAANLLPSNSPRRVCQKAGAGWGLMVLKETRLPLMVG